MLISLWEMRLWVNLIFFSILLSKNVLFFMIQKEVDFVCMGFFFFRLVASFNIFILSSRNCSAPLFQVGMVFFVFTPFCSLKFL